MEAREVVVNGDLTKDGRLILDETPDLPPGKVRVQLRALPEGRPDADDFWARLKRIRAQRKAMGVPDRSFEEIVADVDAMRDEWDDD